jgi:DNA-binding transcriptional LysR family regulator
MNFTHLFAFFEVARAGSISAGAERLHVSQPAITREIRNRKTGSDWHCLIGCRAV